MWIARWTFVGIVILALVGISLQNKTLVDITILKWHWAGVPLFLVIYLSFAVGMVVFFLVAAFKQVQQSLELARCNREIRKLQKELSEVRTIETKPVEETEPVESTDNEETPADDNLNKAPD